MQQLTVINQAILTMTSLELVEYINSERDTGATELRHDHFMAKVPYVLGLEHAPKFRGIYLDAYGREKPCYDFPKREACLMAMSYSYDLQAKVFDRMTALEAKQTTPATPVVPQSLSAALRLAADQADLIEQQQAQLAIAAPKAAFVDNYVVSTGLKGFREVAKLLKANEARLRDFLSDRKIMYRLGGEWVAFQPHIDAGRFAVKAGASQINGHAFNRSLFTPKGIEWMAGLWAVHCLGDGAAV